MIWIKAPRTSQRHLAVASKGYLPVKHQLEAPILGAFLFSILNARCNVTNDDNQGDVMMMKLLSISAAVTFLFMSNAMAEPRFPCAADIQKACADVQPGGGRIVACVKEHFKDFSDVCKERLSTIATAAKVCREDLEKQCGTPSLPSRSSTASPCIHRRSP